MRAFIYHLLFLLFGSNNVTIREVPFTSIGSIPRIPADPAKSINVNDWIDLKIDYRTCGDRHQQHVKLQIDFGMMVYAAAKIGREQEARDALSHYAQLIQCGYVEPLESDLA